MIKLPNTTKKESNMSQQQSILNLIGIKDKNISFISCELEKLPHRGKLIEQKVIYAALQAPRNPKCPRCEGITISWGSTPSKIRVPQAFDHPTLLHLKKARYRCKSCGYTHTLETSLVAKNCFISRATRESIMIRSLETIPEKIIAKLTNVSPSTVSRVLNPLLYERKTNIKTLPKNIMIDELKLMKDTEGAAMSFIFADAKTHEIQDILPDRRLHHLETYFRQFPREARYHVETVTMDMYAPYIQLVKEVFPKAKIILDRFHVVQLLLRALLQTRIQTMKKFPKDSKEYKLLKKYWKHLQKKHKDLDSVYRFYCYHTRSYSTSFEKVEELLEIDEELTKTYWRVHSLIQGFMEGDQKRFFDLLHQETTGVSSYLVTAIQTLRKMEDYLINSMEYGYSNGPLEGLIRKAKTLSRVAYGYRSFERFKNRFLLICHQVMPVTGRPLYYKKKAS